MEKIFEFKTTQFDFDLINHIKEIRESKELNKEDLSKMMGLASSFVGNVESFTQRHKYSTRHLTLLAKAFGFKNISDLLNFPTPKFDKIKVTVKQTMNEAGSKVLQNEVLRIEEVK
ncbi:helix-turn-helix domain-containing protein [Flavobacterium soli]|uniref:helix-turn-helix domain-containing protein n=1 Tax=Flavobacterium soli TaxID=344881 RepID=UPI0004278B8F|nr:helix-turn-helix transcriptional regulator [Flavobacterium soli]